jgi:hypothetical protein
MSGDYGFTKQAFMGAAESRGFDQSEAGAVWDSVVRSLEKEDGRLTLADMREVINDVLDNGVDIFPGNKEGWVLFYDVAMRMASLEK